MNETFKYIERMVSIIVFHYRVILTEAAPLLLMRAPPVSVPSAAAVVAVPSSVILRPSPVVFARAMDNQPGTRRCHRV
jgi:hypothetical protein